MRLNIGTRILVALLSLTFLGGIFGVYTVWQMHEVASYSRSIYEHPLAVSNAVRDIRAEIFAMHRGMRDVATSPEREERLAILAELETAELRVEDRFELLHQRFLGGDQVITRAEDAWHNWRPIRMAVVVAMDEGRTEEALSITKTRGTSHVNEVIRLTEDVSFFAGKMASKFLGDAESAAQSAMWTTAGFAASLFLIGLLLAYLVTRSVARPLSSISNVARRIAQGNFSERTGLSGADELGVLSGAFDAMADSVEKTVEGLSEKTRQLQQTAAELATRQRSHEAVIAVSRAVGLATSEGELAQRCLDALLDVTESQVGALYRVEEGGAARLLLSRGMAAGRTLPSLVNRGEGAVGTVLQSGRPVMDKVARETQFIVQNLAGDMLPVSLVHFPLSLGDSVEAIVSLASLVPFDESRRGTLEATAQQIAVAFANLRTSRRNHEMAEEMVATNEELLATNEELQSQSEELREQADEMREQARILESQKKQVADADRMKSEFLANMSHELRTPLNAVLSLTQLLISRGTGKDTAEEQSFLQVIERNGRQLLDMLNSLLDLSKIEAGRMDLLVERISVTDLLRRAMESVAPQAEAKALKLQMEIPEPCTLTTDPDKAKQVLVNLLANAVKFTDRGGVTISALCSPDYVRFVVEDTGIGISAEDMERIFEEFQQLDGSTTRRHGGAGLGLTISRKLAELLRGTIRAESVVGEGSRFIFELPIVLDATEPRPALRPLTRPRRPVKPVALNPGEHPRVLLVDDNQAALLQVKAVLERAGYSVDAVASGPEALRSVTEQVPDALILDLIMPGMDGFGVLERLRAHPVAGQVPVLVLTARELSKADLDRLAANNVVQLLTKGGIEPDELREAVARTCGHAVVEAPVVEPEQPGNRDVLAAGPRSGPVLVVEDSPDNVLVVSSVLEGRCEIVVADNGHAALQAVEERKPSLILMDIQLPDMSGTDAMREIRTNHALSDVPIVALTARAMLGDRERFLADGFDDYLAKPFRPDQLRGLVDRWLNGDFNDEA